MVIDYNQLNKNLDDEYPLPNIEEILDNMKKFQYFTADSD